MFDFTIVVLEGAFASGVAVSRDMLAAAEALAVRAGVPAPRWRICSVDGGVVALQGGLTVPTTRLPRRASKTNPDHSVWVLPGLWLNSPREVAQRLAADDAQQLIGALRKHVAAGGQVAASCSAVFVLQAAGALSEKNVTTTWWLAPSLQSLDSGMKVDADRIVCVDGPVTTAGSAYAQTDLMLHLLRERCGNVLRDLVSRIMLIDGRNAQAPFMLPEVMANGDELVVKLARRIEDALPDVPSVATLATELCMSERTLARHIHRATGKSTQTLIQSVRLRRARALLEGTRLTVDQIAEAVGYRDSTALRRIMKARLGATPGRYRPSLGA